MERDFFTKFSLEFTIEFKEILSHFDKLYKVVARASGIYQEVL